jgi:ABC-type transport system involved in multi-copper enzyme maturation permease subunit
MMISSLARKSKLLLLISSLILAGYSIASVAFVTSSSSAYAQSAGNATSGSTGNKTAATAPSGNITSSLPSGNASSNAPGGGKSVIGNATITSTPSLVLTPSIINPGKQLIAAGSGFGANKTVTLTIDDKPLSANRTITTNAKGEFSATVTIPADTSVGGHAVTAKDASGAKVSVRLSVIAAG